MDYVSATGEGSPFDHQIFANRLPDDDAASRIDAIASALGALLKAGPQPATAVQDIYAVISRTFPLVAPSVEAVTARYELVCQRFLDDVIAAGGIPIRAITSSDEMDSRNINSHRNKAFDAALPSMNESFKWCLKNFHSQADRFLAYQLSLQQEMLRDFLELVTIGKSMKSTAKKKLTEIKKQLRFLAKWDRLFYTYKAMSFPTEIERILILSNQHPVAAIWRYSRLDQDVEYPHAYNHQDRDNRVYAIRDSWALKNGLVKVGESGYLDEVSLPGQDLGCMCSLEWIASPDRVPTEMQR
ncbi:MAG TPA: hypothetical protein VMA98_11650 [Candidatus Acidoferrales bacterium]|nr:hypothetical protein [Candidatus Acidoferrales bacterium]